MCLQGPATCVAFSRDGDLFASGSSDEQVLNFWVIIQIHISLKTATFCSLLSMGKAKVCPLSIQYIWTMLKWLAVLLTFLEVKPNFFGGKVGHVTFQETHSQLPNCKYALALAQCEVPCWKDRLHPKVVIWVRVISLQRAVLYCC